MVVEEYTIPTKEINYKQDGKNIKYMLYRAKNSREISENQKFNRFQEIIQKFSFSVGHPEISVDEQNNISLFFRKNDSTILIDELGDGVKDIIIIIAICVLNPEIVIFIEEPESHLHPRAINELLQLFQEELTYQVFLTTHHPSFLNNIDDETTIIKISKVQEKHDAIQIKTTEDMHKFKIEYDLFEIVIFYFTTH